MLFNSVCSYFWSKINYVIIIFSAIILFRPLFEKGFPVLVDNPVHLAETLYLIENLLPKYHWINGWCPADFAGFPILLYHYILGKLLIAGMNIFLGIQVITAYKLMMLVSIIFPACTLFLLFSKICGKLPATFSALFFILHINNIEKILEGMWNNYFSLGFLPLFILTIIRLFDSISIKYVPCAAILLSLTFMSHQYVAIAECIFAIIYFAVSLIIDRRNILHIFFMLFAIGILSAAVSLFYLFPIIDTSKSAPANRAIGVDQIKPVSSIYYFSKDLLNIPKTISIKNQLVKGNIREFCNGILNNIWINIAMLFFNIVAILGIRNMLFNKGSVYRKISISCGVFIGVMLIVASDIWRVVPFLNNMPFSAGIENSHFILFSHFGLLYFASFGIKYLLELKKEIMKITLFVMATLFIAGLLALSTHFKENQFFLTSENLREFDDIKRFWDWTGRNIDGSKMRIWIQRTKGNSKNEILNNSHILSLTQNFSGVNHIGAWYGFQQRIGKLVDTENKKIFGMRTNNLREEILIKRMYLFNTGYMAVVENNLKKLLDNFAQFEKSADIGFITVFKLKNFNPMWIEFIQGKGIASFGKLAPQNISVNITTFETDIIMRIKIQNHPYWKAYMDGVPTKLEDDEFGLMKIRIKNKGHHELKLVYKSINIFSILISIISLLVCLVLILFFKVERAKVCY
ncbi:MAG: hypothetical protein A3C43_11930 [Candidatus Schekmanbacteria bacterium RIFCSPHIGHO2_02_FULL_38_11]|nr:MAG: hypothetical protein A2043_10870 [Candidatus Schekmanbacteria bacterium GWA2_38_9]OGL50567.1 MAG: hypothetical protein A3C43_11930 [Candidatus Schekmanbacteria bacterium RIFCSPHIGHO2_02_FULL_38_11]